MLLSILFQPTVQNLRSSFIAPPRSIHIGLAPKGLSRITDCTEVVARTPSIKIHRTAHYLLAATPVKAEDSSEALPVVASINAFLGQKTLSLESTIQVGISALVAASPLVNSRACCAWF